MNDGTQRVRSAASSRVEMTHIIQPEYTNMLGTAFGGQILAWMDTAASVAAMRHCGGPAVTVAMDEVTFSEPIKQGEIVTLCARIAYTGTSSMEVDVVVYAESIGMARREAVKACLTFVAIDKQGKPVPVPGMLPDGEREQSRFDEGEERARLRRMRT